MKSFYRNPHIYAPFLIACILFAIAFFVWFTEFSEVSDRLILHEDTQGQIDLTGPRKEVFFEAGAAWVFFLLNMFLARASYARERLLSYMLSYVNVWIGVLALIYISSIANLN